VTDPASFAASFAEAWAEPTPDRLMSLLHPDVRLVAPLMATTVGHDEARREFTRLFELMPDIRGRVQRWSGTEDVVFIEFTLSGTLRGHPIEWQLVDRFRLEDGLGIERVSYFDPLPLVAAFARVPSAWVRLWRSGLGPPMWRRRLLKR
jgi:ketosteroid isomerase-like protein